MTGLGGDAELIRNRVAEVIGRVFYDEDGGAVDAARALADAGLLAVRLRSTTGQPGYVDVGPSPDVAGGRLLRFVEPEQTDMPTCVAHGGHCFVPVGMTLMSSPPQHPERCRHCPATRIGVKHDEPMAYTYPEGQP